MCLFAAQLRLFGDALLHMSAPLQALPSLLHKALVHDPPQSLSDGESTGVGYPARCPCRAPAPSTGLTQFGHGSWLGGGAVGLESQSICGTGGLFRAGYDATLDELRDSVSKAKQNDRPWIGNGNRTSNPTQSLRVRRRRRTSSGSRRCRRRSSSAPAYRISRSGLVRSGRVYEGVQLPQEAFSLLCSATQTIATCGVAHVPFSLRHATCACSGVHSVFCLDAIAVARCACGHSLLDGHTGLIRSGIRACSGTTSVCRRRQPRAARPLHCLRST